MPWPRVGDVTFVLLKLDQALQHLSGMLATVDLFETTPEQKDQALYEEMLTKYGSGQWDGDRDRWPDEIEQSQWTHMTATHRECSNRRCAHFQNCAFFKARAQVEDADIIVANHDLVLADLSLGEGLFYLLPIKPFTSLTKAIIWLTRRSIIFG